MLKMIALGRRERLLLQRERRLRKRHRLASQQPFDILMAYMVMAYMLMSYIVMALYSYGPI